MSNDRLMRRVEGASTASDPVTRVRATLDAMRADLAQALARTKGLSAERFARVALTTLRTNPALQECSPASLIAALVQSAQLGLEPDPRLGHAYLVPYKGACQLIIGYRGRIELARRSGEVASIEAHVVYEADTFRAAYGTSAELVHVPALRDRGEPMAVYAFARLRDGTTMWDILGLDDIERARASSRTKGGPWQDHWAEMARKTAINRLAKYLPMTPEAAEADAADGAVVRGLRGGDVLLDDPDDRARPALAGADVERADLISVIRGHLGGGVPFDRARAEAGVGEAWESAPLERLRALAEIMAPAVALDDDPEIPA